MYNKTVMKLKSYFLKTMYYTVFFFYKIKKICITASNQDDETI